MAFQGTAVSRGLGAILRQCLAAVTPSVPLPPPLRDPSLSMARKVAYRAHGRSAGAFIGGTASGFKCVGRSVCALPLPALPQLTQQASGGPATWPTITRPGLAGTGLARHLSGVGFGTGGPDDSKAAGGGTDRTSQSGGPGGGGHRGPADWALYLLKLLMVTSGAFLWLDVLSEWLYLSANPEVLESEKEMLIHDEREMRKFYDVLTVTDREVFDKQAALGAFNTTLLADPVVRAHAGDGAVVVNDPDSVYVEGPHAVDALREVAGVPAGLHPRDHWAPSLFLAGPRGVVAAVVAFRRGLEEAEWIPHRCCGVALLPKDGDPLFSRSGSSRHGLKYTTRFG